MERHTSANDRKKKRAGRGLNTEHFQRRAVRHGGSANALSVNPDDELKQERSPRFRASAYTAANGDEGACTSSECLQDDCKTLHIEHLHTPRRRLRAEDETRRRKERWSPDGEVSCLGSFSMPNQPSVHLHCVRGTEQRRTSRGCVT